MVRTLLVLISVKIISVNVGAAPSITITPYLQRFTESIKYGIPQAPSNVICLSPVCERSIELRIKIPSKQDGSLISMLWVPSDIPKQVPFAWSSMGSVHLNVILFAILESPEAPQEDFPAQRFPRTSR